MGEGGTNGACACVVNGVLTVLPDADRSTLRKPFHSRRVWEAVHGGN